MRFTEAMAHLAVALRDPLAEYTELLRAVREGIDDTLEATERKLSRMAAEEGHPFDWGGGTFKDLLRGKPGPGGGFEASPAVLAFFLTAYLLDCPRREAAAKALDMTFAAAAYSGAHHRRQDRSPTHPSPCNRRAARKARRSVRGPSSAISARRLWRCCPIAPCSIKWRRYVSLPILALHNFFSGITPRRIFTPPPATTRRGRAHTACVFSTST